MPIRASRDPVRVRLWAPRRSGVQATRRPGGERGVKVVQRERHHHEHASAASRLAGAPAIAAVAPQTTSHPPASARARQRRARAVALIPGPSPPRTASATARVSSEAKGPVTFRSIAPVDPPREARPRPVTARTAPTAGVDTFASTRVIAPACEPPLSRAARARGRPRPPPRTVEPLAQEGADHAGGHVRRCPPWQAKARRPGLTATRPPAWPRSSRPLQPPRSCPLRSAASRARSAGVSFTSAEGMSRQGRASRVRL